MAVTSSRPLEQATPAAGPSSSGSSPLSDVPAKSKAKAKSKKDTAVTSTEGTESKEYCHQCRRLVFEPLQCTVIRKTGKGPKATSFRCGRSYCSNDLRKYGLEAAAIRSAGRIDEDSGMHDPQTAYTWSCMACRDVCDCSTCRKKRGLEPLGNAKSVDKSDQHNNVTAEGTGVSKAAKAKKTVKKPVKTEHTITKEKKEKKEKKIEKDGKSTPVATGAKAKVTKANTGKVKSDATKEVKPKATKAKVPKTKEIKEVKPPVFERVATSLSKTEGEDRMELREFIFRFKSILGLPDRNLGPLDDFDRPIAEASVRSLTGSLLDLLRGEVDDDEDETLETCREEMRYHADLVRFASIMRRIAPVLKLNLPAATNVGQSKIQSNTEAMRALLDLDDDESAPSWSVFQPESGTRRGASKVPLPAEVVAMLLAICNRALETDKLRQELVSASGEFEARSRVAGESKVLKEEWDARKKKLAEEKLRATSASATKAWRENQAKEEKAYRMKQAKLNVNLRVFLNRKALRHDPLGTDKDGRVYYLLSPRHIGEDTRAPFAWASGVMVWGKGVQQSKGSEDEDLPHEVERWTHFGSHSDVKQLAEWVIFLARPPPASATPKKRKTVEVAIPTSVKKRKVEAHSSESSLSSLSNGVAQEAARGQRAQSFDSNSSGLTPPPDEAELDRQMSLRTLLKQHKKYTPNPELQQERAKELAARLMEAAEWLELLEHLGLAME